MSKNQSAEDYTDEEATRRMNEALKRALNTPHQPHKPKSHPAKQTSAAKPKPRGSRRAKPGA